VFQDGSEYQGNFEHGVFQGYGRYAWPKQTSKGSAVTEQHCGHWYQGDWTDGKMDGEGEFHHREGHVLKPHFRGNLFFIKESGSAINPFLCENEVRNFLGRITDHSDGIEAAAKHEAEKVNLHRVRDGPSLAPTLQMVRQSGRTPLIVSAFENPACTDDIRNHMDVSDPSRENHLYLRSLGHELAQGGYEHIAPIKAALVNEYEEELRDQQAKWFLTINFDEDDPDTERPWKYLYFCMILILIDCCVARMALL
jgi:hypothetical protein